MRRALILLPVLAIVAASLGVLGLPWKHDDVLRLPGVVEIQEVRPGSKIGGRVAAVAVREKSSEPGPSHVIEGDLVEAGQPLVWLDVPELKAQRDQAAARLKAAEAALEKARNGPRSEEIAAARANFQAAKARNDRMKAGWRAEEIREAQGDVNAAEADLQLARQDFDRISRLFSQGTSVGRSEYDAAHAALDRARGKSESARSKLEMYHAGNRVEDIAEVGAALAKSQADLALLEAGTRKEDIAVAEADVAEAKGRLDELEADLREAVVKSPDRAIVEVISVRMGDLLAPNTPVARLLLRGRDLWVKVYVPEPDVGKVRLGQKVNVTVDAYPKRLFPGEIIQVASVAEFTPRNVQSLEGRRSQVFGVKVRVDDPEGAFKSGMAAEVVVPLTATQSRESRQ